MDPPNPKIWIQRVLKVKNIHSLKVHHVVQSTMHAAVPLGKAHYSRCSYPGTMTITYNQNSLCSKLHRNQTNKSGI